MPAPQPYVVMASKIPMPRLADGSTPRAEQRVTHPDGTAGRIRWTRHGTYYGPTGTVTDVWTSTVAHERGDGTTETRVRLTETLSPAGGAR